MTVDGGRVLAARVVLGLAARVLELVANTVTAPLLDTRYGCVPHLTSATLHYETPRAAQEAPLLASWQHRVIKQQAVLRAYGRGLASFMGLPKRGLVLTVQVRST